MTRAIRFIVFGLPVLLVALLVGSLASIKLIPLRQKNQMVMGGIGEAKILNPILYTTAADSEVLTFVFNGLLKYDENLEITGELAESWDLKQTSTLYFTNPAQAQAALQRVNAMKEQWQEWSLVRAAVEDEALILLLEEPGRRVSAQIFEQLPAEFMEPVSIIRIEMESGARDSAHHFREVARHAQQIKRIWIDTSRAYELTVAGDAGAVAAELREHYALNPSLEAKVTVGETLRWLDEPEVIFKLRPDVRWHDGTPFTADDVEFTYRMIMSESVASPRRPDYELIHSVQVVTPHQVRVVYRRPYSPALLSWMMGMLPKHILDGQPTAWWAQNFNRSPIGTGPFKFHSWRTNDHILLVRNDDYFEGPPHLDSIALRVIPDPLSIRLAFETRQIDFWGVAEHAVGAFRDDPRYELFPSPAPAFTYVGWNLRRPLFQDLRVRQALAHAVNIPAIIEYVLYGYGRQSTGIFPPQMWFFNQDVKPLEYDPERARQLLAEAGWKPGPDGILQKDGERFAFRLITNQANEIRKDIATLVQADLRQVGIRVDVEIYEWAVFIEQYINKGDFDATVLGWNLGYDYDQYQLWHSSQTGPGQLNHAGYANPEVDRLLDELRTEYDHDEIKRIAGELQARIYEDQPYLFLYVPETTGAMRQGAFRVMRPDAGQWLEEPVRSTKAGFRFYSQWFFRPEYQPTLRP